MAITVILSFKLTNVSIAQFKSRGDSVPLKCIYEMNVPHSSNHYNHAKVLRLSTLSSVVLNPNLWPKDIMVKPFKFSKNVPNAVQL